MKTQVDQLQEELKTREQIKYIKDVFLKDIAIKTLFESLSEGIIIANGCGNIIAVNNRIERLFGYTKEELTGKSLGILLRPNARENHEEKMRVFFQSPTIRPMGIGFDLIALSKSQKEIQIEISLSYLNTSSGDFSLAFISDISKRKKAESDILEKNEALEAFAHTVAHDLKGSLSNIIGFTNLIVGDDNIESDKLQEVLELILLSGNKMNEIIDAILFMSKVDMAKIELKTLDMEEIIENVLSRLKLEIQQNNAQVNWQLDDSIIHALGYDPWVEEIVFNLVGNALKHGGESPKITIGCDDTGEFVKYFVQNDGILLSEDSINTLYQSISEVKIAAASGFGLSIVYRILKKLGGELKIESSEKDGNVFSFFLPKKAG